MAITAEPGGSEAVRQRLVERGVPELDYEVRSDPGHAFLMNGPPTPPEDLFVMKDHEWEVSGDYKMIQPALVVYGPDNKLLSETTWSWKTIGLDDTTTLDWDTRVDLPASSLDKEEKKGEPEKQVLLVTLRPDFDDLLSAIKEKRPIKLASTHKEW